MSKSSRIGFTQVYTGDGKGKTTAAIGLAIRAAGAGKRVFIGQFIKGSDSSEMKLLRERCPEVEIIQFGEGRFIKGAPSGEDVEKAKAGVRRIAEALSSGEYDVVIVDEGNSAASAGLLQVDELLSLIDRRPPEVELVITGRDAHEDLIARADLVTEMRKVKHMFDAGVSAREGIEY